MVRHDRGGPEGVNRETTAQIIAKVARIAGGEAPYFAIMHVRDWWALRRGLRWRYPLPVRRTFRARRRPILRMRRTLIHRLRIDPK